jgi:hypothetical protein
MFKSAPNSNLIPRLLSGLVSLSPIPDEPLHNKIKTQVSDLVEKSVHLTHMVNAYEGETHKLGD